MIASHFRRLHDHADPLLCTKVSRIECDTFVRWELKPRTERFSIWQWSHHVAVDPVGKQTHSGSRDPFFDRFLDHTSRNAGDKIEPAHEKSLDRSHQFFQQRLLENAQFESSVDFEILDMQPGFRPG